ncbi:MAG TPA: RNA degradosome polyphosphate kinase, partial [Gemmatimonadales bacterium]
MRPTRPPAFSPEHYLNRELSWLEFNHRVLEEARDEANPLLERLKFLSIFSSNLDEFFEVRVAGLQQQLYAGLEPQDYGADGLGPGEQLTAIERRVHDLVGQQYRVLREDVWPALAAKGVERLTYSQLTVDERAQADRLFAGSVYPVLTPLAIDPGHPFPHVHNKSLNIALLIEGEHGGTTQQLFGVVQVPAVLDRVVVLNRGEDRVRYLLLEDMIREHLSELFRGFQVVGHTVFRVTRNTDLAFDEDEAEDLLQSI